MSTDGKLMCVVAALRHGIQTTNTPGLAVNNHPNPFFLHVMGELDLKHVAERVITNLEQYYIAEQKRREADAATAASAVDGH
jgi:hypothetical protein